MRGVIVIGHQHIVPMLMLAAIGLRVSKYGYMQMQVTGDYGRSNN